MNHFRKEEDPMEKYEKPVMVLEAIVDEIHTYAVYPDAVVVSEEFNGRPNNNHPYNQYVP